MLNFNLSQKLSIKMILFFLRVINLLDFEVRWVLFSISTVLLTVSFWNFKDTSIDELMLLTRRQPVLSLADTVPQELLIINTQEVKTETKPPEKILTVGPLNLLAKSYLIYDLKNNREITAFNKSETLPPASLVKVLSVMYLTDNLNFSDKYKMTPECSQVYGQKVGFKIGEEVSVKDLIYSSLIFSGADSICLLSRIDSTKNIAEFNNYARRVGLTNSNFTNYIGLDYTNNFTTSQDMLTMTKKFLENKVFGEIVSLKSFQLENQKIIYNTNKMLFSDKNSLGVKTGTTDGANENLIYRYKNSEKDIDILVIILNSSDRYYDSNQIIKNLYLN
jgi:D-alanyl-D-alanine carboxypeptidase